MKRDIFLIFLGLTSLSAYSQNSVSDIEGNVYKTVTVGSQVWMAENLRSTKFNDGVSIPLVVNASEWQNTQLPAYCWYQNEEATYKKNYGALYNFYAIATNKVCPQGWHVPTSDEWDILVKYLGGENVAGGKLKMAGTEFWKAPNVGATNEIGFNGIAGGLRLYAGDFIYVNEFGYWWSNSVLDATKVINQSIFWNAQVVGKGKGLKQVGCSVRCLLGNPSDSPVIETVKEMKPTTPITEFSKTKTDNNLQTPPKTEQSTTIQPQSVKNEKSVISQGPALEECVEWLRQNVNYSYSKGNVNKSTSFEMAGSDPNFITMTFKSSDRSSNNTEVYKFKLSDISKFELSIDNSSNIIVLKITTFEQKSLITKTNYYNYYGLLSDEESSTEINKYSWVSVPFFKFKYKSDGEILGNKALKVFNRISEIMNNTPKKTISDDWFNK